MKRGAEMPEDEKARLPDENDEELIDTLTAISVIAKRLARRLRRQSEEKKTEDKVNEQNE